MNHLPTDWLIWLIIAPMLPFALAGWYLGCALGRVFRDVP